MSELIFDLRHSLRALTRTPAFTLGVLAILALGLGANILIFSVFDTVLLRPMGYDDPDRLSYVWPERAWFSKRELVAFREHSKALDGTAGYYLWGRNTLIEGGEPEVLHASQVTANFFSVLGVAPLDGRGFLEGEDRPGAERVAVLSYGFWQRRFGGDPGLVGRALDLDGHPTTVVGVMPAGFSFRVEERDLWVPLVIDPAAAGDYDENYVQAVARLAGGVSRAEAEADTRRASALMWKELAVASKRPETLTLPRFQDAIVEDVRPMLVWLLIAVGALLLIASVNVANLLLTRGAGRGRELAIRSALGCGRWRIARLLLAESLLLSLAGGVCALGLAGLALNALVASLPEWIPRTDEIVVDARVALAGLVLSLLTGLAFGAAPSLALARRRIFGLLRESSGAVGARSRGRGLLVVAEVALAFVLVAAAGLSARSFWQAATESPGFDAAGVYTFDPTLPDAAHQAVSVDGEAAVGYDTAAARNAFYGALRERLEATPGIEAAGAIHMLPIRVQGFNGFLDVEGHDVEPSERPIVNWRVVTPGYFSTLGVPRRAGRVLDERDRAGAAHAVVVNETFAERYLQGGDPLGRRIKISIEENAGWLTVVGVVGDVRQHGLTSPVRPEIYRNVEQVELMVGLTFLVRSSLDEAATWRVVREAVAAVDPHVPVAFEKSMASVVRESLSFQRLILTLASILAGLAMVLGAAGIYAVVAFDVSRRTAEIGLRMALGARRDGVWRMVLRQGLVPVGVGLVLGTALSLALGRFVRSLLYEVEPGDPATYAAMSAVLAAVAVLAVGIPAWRASRVEPLEALRYE